jgi:hypothetical protein
MLITGKTHGFIVLRKGKFVLVHKSFGITEAEHNSDITIPVILPVLQQACSNK